MTKRKFFIQWDSTNNCNLRCSHCYHNREGRSEHIQDDDSQMDFEDVKKMVDDLDNTCKRWGFSPRLQISGGEPMLRKDLIEILDYTNRAGIETRILTNGTLINSANARELHQRGIQRLQISVDGSRERHNKIRGREYAYDRAMDGIKNCADAGIAVTVSMTAMQSNRGDFEDVVLNSIKNNAKYVGFQSYVPNPRLGMDDPEFIGAKETYSLFKEARRLDKIYEGKIKILQTEVLWQIMQWDTKLKREARESGKFLSGCGAGFSGISVLADGTVYPCRRLPIPIGDISEGISAIMLDKQVMKDLRNFDKVRAGGCCEDSNYCRGCRAIAYAITGDYMAKDPMCFKQFINLQTDIEPRVIRR